MDNTVAGSISGFSDNDNVEGQVTRNCCESRATALSLSCKSIISSKARLRNSNTDFLALRKAANPLADIFKPPVDLATAHYIIHYFPRLLTQNEATALRHYSTLIKMGAPEKYKSAEAYQQRLNSHKEQHHITDNPEVLKLLESGIEQFYLNTAARIQKQALDKVYFNYCPKCKQLARTPYAKQCRHCGYNWHNTVSADFRISRIFELQTQPSMLFIAGDIVKGTIKEGMAIDLTFLGVAAKPRIGAVNYLDLIAEKRTQLTLSVRVDSTEDREYLKKRGSLAVPITIEV